MKLFKINNRTSIVAKFEPTRSGFRHLATLMIDGQSRDTAKVTYLNRTWERFEFDTVITKLIGQTPYLSAEEKVTALANLQG